MEKVRPCVVEVPARIYQLSDLRSWPGRVYPREVFERALREGVPARSLMSAWHREWRAPEGANGAGE